MTTSIDLGNNETATIGIIPQLEGDYLALTMTASKRFKTYRGAAKWLERRGFDHMGRRIA